MPDHAICIDTGATFELIEESTWHTNLYFSRWFRNDVTTKWKWRVDRSWTGVNRIQGLVGHCYHRYGYQYFHWLVDVMPRVWLLKSSFAAELDCFFMGPLDRPFQRPMLNLYGLKDEACVIAHSGIVGFEQVICPGFRFAEPLRLRPAFQSGVHFKGWSAPFIDDIRDRARTQYATTIRPEFERIYVSREDAHHRHVRNEKEIRLLLDSLGFKTVVPGRMAFEDQVSLFASARIIVGVHGAGLTNIAWAKPGASLLELIPEHLEDAGYRFLSNLAGHRHSCILCQQFSHPQGAAYADIEVDVQSLREALSGLLC